MDSSIIKKESQDVIGNVYEDAVKDYNFSDNSLDSSEVSDNNTSDCSSSVASSSEKNQTS